MRAYMRGLHDAIRTLHSLSEERLFITLPPHIFCTEKKLLFLKSKYLQSKPPPYKFDFKNNKRPTPHMYTLSTSPRTSCRVGHSAWDARPTCAIASEGLNVHTTDILNHLGLCITWLPGVCLCCYTCFCYLRADIRCSSTCRSDSSSPTTSLERLIQWMPCACKGVPATTFPVLCVGSHRNSIKYCQCG